MKMLLWFFLDTIKYINDFTHCLKNYCPECKLVHILKNMALWFYMDQISRYSVYCASYTFRWYHPFSLWNVKTRFQNLDVSMVKSSSKNGTVQITNIGIWGFKFNNLYFQVLDGYSSILLYCSCLLQFIP